MKKLFVPLFLAALLLGCSSFPKNEEGSDSLLLVPIQLDKSMGGEAFGSIHMTIKDVGGNQAAELTLKPTSQYAYVSLSPGQYVISDYMFIFGDRVYGSQQKGKKVKMNIPITTKPGTITVLSHYLQYKLYKESVASNKIFTQYNFLPVTADVKDNLNIELEKEPSYGTWNIEFQ